MQPSVGRIVHYQPHDPYEHRGLVPPQAAIITACNPWPEETGATDVMLTVFGTKGFELVESVPFADEPTPGCWNWPPRVEG